MKTFILLIIFIAGTFLSFSQTRKELSNEAREKLEGKWVGQVNGDSITIHLVQTVWRKLERITPFPLDTFAFIFGWYEMSNKHGLIASDLDSMSYEITSGFSLVTLYTKTMKQIPFKIVDLIHRRSVDAMLTFINSDEAILKTWIAPSCMMDFDRGKPKSFPDEIRLTRISRNPWDLISIKNSLKNSDGSFLLNGD